MTTAHIRPLAATILIAGFTTACARVDGAAPAAPRPVHVQTLAATPVAADIRYTATIEPRQQLALAFKAAGYVEHVADRRGADGRPRAAQAGDVIAKGALLARVRTAEYRERVGQGRAKLAESHAGLVKAQADLARAKTLFASQSLTRPELDAAQAAFDAADARVRGAVAEVELAESALRDCALIAPASGVLLERKIEVGSLVGTGSVGFTLADVSAVKARFGIPDAMLAAVALGARLGVVVEGVAGRSFEGRVTALAPAADAQSRVFDVEVSIANADGALRPGMIGTVVFQPAGRPTAAALIVPMGAVVRASNGAGYAVVLVARDGDRDVARVRPVTLGDVVGNGVAVTAGLAAGDRVIVSGASLLTDGDAVSVVP
jgi:RND family efflux transporter MFP subunit